MAKVLDVRLQKVGAGASFYIPARYLRDVRNKLLIGNRFDLEITEVSEHDDQGSA